MSTVTVHDLRATIGKASAASAHHVYRSLKRLFRFLELEDLISQNPTKRLSPPKMLTKAIQPLTTEEVSRLYATARRRGGYFGIRNSAIRGSTQGALASRMVDKSSLNAYANTRFETGVLHSALNHLVWEKTLHVKTKKDLPI